MEIQNIDNGVTCSFDSSTNTLQISNGFPSGLAANTEIQFQVSTIKAPLSFSPVTAQVQTTNQAGSGVIDKGTATIVVTKSASISLQSISTSADDTTVQAITNFRLEFSNPVPLNPGALFTILFPIDFSFNSKLSDVQGYGIFGSIKSLSFTQDQNQKSVKLTQGIDSYKTNNIKGILIFKQVQLPSEVKPSDTFSIIITDAQGFSVASITSDITFTPTSGVLQNVQLTSSQVIVNSQTSILVQFQPLHSLSSSSMIHIELPQSLDTNCTNFQESGGFSSSITCSETSPNVFNFTSVFTSSYTYQQSKTLMITFNSAKNPSASQNISGISISTYEIIQGLYYLVDTYSDQSSIFYTVTASEFLSQNLYVNTDQTYTLADFTFEIIPDIDIPQDGLLKIVIPSSIKVEALKCNGIKNIASSLQCSYSQSNSIIMINNGFQATSTAREQLISFTISGLRTPNSTQTSQSFQIYSMDSQSHIIDQTTQQLTVTMSKGINIPKMTSYSNSSVVSAPAQISLSFQSPVPLIDGDQFTITIPDRLNPPNSQNLICNGADNLQSNLICSISGKQLIVKVKLSSSPYKENTGYLTVKFKSVQNPDSTKPTGEFSLVIQDAMGFIKAQSLSNNTSNLMVSEPATILNSKMYPQDNRQRSNTSITFIFTTSNFIPANGYLIVTYPQDYYQIYIENQKYNCTSTLIKKDNVGCTFIKSGLTVNKIKYTQFNVTDIFPTDFQRGQQVDFTINKVMIDLNVTYTIPTWNITTFTPDNYVIDRASSGMTLTFLCNEPCLTCKTQSPDYCYTCNSNYQKNISHPFILYNNTCLDDCPDGQYFDFYSNQCKLCSSQCKTCNSYNPNECLSCNSNSKDYSFLDGSTCTSTCGAGSFGNPKTAKCEKCLSPCQTCNGNATSCLTCVQSSKTPFQLNMKCYSQCPSGYVDLEDDTNICQKCDSNCLTCSVSQSQCTSCNSPLILSQYDQKCVETCPFGITIYNSTTQICDACDSKCNSCQGKTKFCTSCAQNLNLWVNQGTCQGDCSSEKKAVGIDGVCTYCSSQCVTCVNKPDSCLSCTKGQFLYDYTCVTACPSGYEADQNNQCVIKGLRCPFGQEPNYKGTACQLKAQVCENGNRLNAAKDRCVPGPGNYAPFPLCFACLFLSIIIIASWIKFRETLVVSNIIAAMSLVETIGILMLIGLAYEMGVYSTFGLALVALIFLYGSNLFFTIVFLKQIQTDSAFKYWVLSYKITQNTIMVIGSVLNFKFYRVIYGRFFGKDHFNAVFDDPEIFFKPFTLISVFSLVTTMLPVFVANIIGLVFVDYGYQVEMTCIELTIIEIVMLGLMIYEKIKLKKYAMKQHQYRKVEPKFLDNSQVNVMSTLIDDQTNMYSLKKLYPTSATQNNKTQENLLTITQKMVQEKEKKVPAEFKEYYDRRRLLEKLISKIYSQDSVISQKELTTFDLIAKLQEDEILRLQERQCRSFRDLKEPDDDFVDQGAADPELQNFISAPTSPREKAMLHNPFFMGRVAEFKKATRQRDQYDNVYAEGKPAHYFPLKDTKLISVKVQTNLLELLAIDDISRIRAKQKVQRHLESTEEEYVEENLNDDYAQGLINDVIDTFKEHQFTKQRRRLPKSRLAQIPNFDLSDIMGEFEIDDNCNSIIIKGKDGKLNDREGRKINKRGYLIDNEGNVITNRGVIIFRNDELDSDEEIPAPFCFEKKKESLFKIEGIQQFTQKPKPKKEIKDEEDEIEREYRRLRQQNNSHQSSVDSLMGENPSKYNKKNKRVMPGDDDGFLSKIVQPMQAKTKSELLKAGIDNIKQNASINFEKTNNRNHHSNLQLEEGSKTFDTQATKNLGQTGIKGTSVRNMTTIGGYDTSIHEQDDDQSNRDLFFSALANQEGLHRQGRPLINLGDNTLNSLLGSRNGTYAYNYSQDLAFQFNKDRISKLDQLKNTLGTSQEDRMLIKQLEKFEQSMMSKNPKEKSKTSLAKRNLEKVYGKVNGKINQDNKPYKKPLYNFLDEETEKQIMRKTQKQPFNDSRLKNLENIYIKNLNQDRKIASQLQKHRVLSSNYQSAWDIDANITNGGQTTAKHRILQNSLQDTGAESSDQEEMRMKQQLEKMKAIIDKGKKINTNIYQRSNRKLFDGGWI